MARLKSQGGISPELMEQAKAAMLEENADYSEAQEPSKRSGAGYPSLGGYIDTHFNFREDLNLPFDFARCARPDGSIYGTGGQCRKGTPAGEKEEGEKKSSDKKAGGGGGPAGEATSADLKTKVELEYWSDSKQDMVKEKLTLGDLKKGGVGNDKLDTLESEVRAGSGLSEQQKEAGLRVLRDDHAALKAEIKNSGVTDKEMSALLTGGPRRLKQTLQTQEDIQKAQLPANGQSRIYAKINRDLRKNGQDLIENQGKYTDLVAKIRAGKASQAEKDKYSKVFGFEATNKTVDKMMSNAAKIKAQRGGGGASKTASKASGGASKPAAKSSGGGAKTKAKATPKPKAPKGGNTYSPEDIKKKSTGELREENQRLYKVSKGKSAGKYDAYGSMDKIAAELRARGEL